MKPGLFRLLRWWGCIREALRMLAFLVLVATVRGVTVYVCGSQAQLITEEGARTLVRQMMPGTW